MGTVNDKKQNIEILSDYESMSAKTLDIFVDQAREFIARQGVFRVAISGGKTPKRFFELLGNEDSSLALDWEKIHIFWVDERYVPWESHWSNYKLANDTFLKKVSIPDENIHGIPTDLPDFKQAANNYEDMIRKVFDLKEGQFPVFDLIILGMGADGHTASLFPDSYALLDTDDLACVVYVMDDKLNRITLTYPVLKTAENLIVLVSGEEKAQTLKEVLVDEPDETKYPIELLWECSGKITWVVDQDAAKLLK